MSSINAAIIFPHLRHAHVPPADFRIAPRYLGCRITEKQGKTTFPGTELPDGSGDDGPPRGPPGARSPHLPFHHSEGPGRRKPGHGRRVVWPGRGTQGRTDLGLCWAPRPVTTLEVFKVLGITVGLWQKAMEPKSRSMAFKEKTSLRIHSAPASGPSEMQTPGHPWLCLQPARAGGASWTPGATWGSSPTLSEGLHLPG